MGRSSACSRGLMISKVLRKSCCRWTERAVRKWQRREADISRPRTAVAPSSSTCGACAAYIFASVHTLSSEPEHPKAMRKGVLAPPIGGPDCFKTREKDMLVPCGASTNCKHKSAILPARATAATRGPGFFGRWVLSRSCVFDR
jgi:hypothetical protein